MIRNWKEVTYYFKRFFTQPAQIVRFKMVLQSKTVLIKKVCRSFLRYYFDMALTSDFSQLNMIETSVSHSFKL